MMRVVGRMFVVAAIASVAVASVANADPVRTMDTSPLSYVSPLDAGGPRAFMSAGFEASEGYALGTCSANNGWRSFGSANATPPGPRAPTGVTGLQGNPGQSLLLDQNPNFPNGTNIGCFSPAFMNPQLPTMNVDVMVDDLGGDDYYVNPQAPSQGFTTARVVFSYGGNIFVLDDLDGAGPGGLSFEDTGVSFGLAEWGTLQITLDPANARIYYSYGPNKDSLVQIYDGYMFGGSIIEEAVLFSTNFQNTGGGSLTGGPAGTYMDNLVLKPEPATLALLGLGTLLVVRRRR